MDIEQFSLKFTGKRFFEHSLPINVFPEFETFQKIVEILAAKNWKENHRDRERLPRGFLESLQLGITQIDEGSTIAALKPIYSTDLFPNGEIENAILSASEIFASNDNFETARNAGPQLKRYIRKFGSSLQEGEGISLFKSSTKDEPLFVFDLKHRSKMIRALSTRERTIHSFGKLLSTKIDDEWQKGKVEIYNPSFGTFVVNEDPDRVKEEFDGSLHHFVEFSLVAEMALTGQVRKILQVDSLELASKEKIDSLESQITSYIGLQDESVGIPISAETVEDCLSFLANFPEIAIRSSVVPGLEGNILIELDLNEWDTTIELRHDRRVEFYGYNLANSEDPAAEFFNTFSQLDERVLSAITERERESW